MCRGVHQNFVDNSVGRSVNCTGSRIASYIPTICELLEVVEAGMLLTQAFDSALDEVKRAQVIMTDWTGYTFCGNATRWAAAERDHSVTQASQNSPSSIHEPLQ